MPVGTIFAILGPFAIASTIAAGCSDRPKSGPAQAETRAVVTRGSCVGKCWDGFTDEITIWFNPMLAGLLDAPGGANAQRMAAFDQAIADWNAALENIEGDDRIKLWGGHDDVYAADQDVQQCLDPPTGNPVYDRDYDGQHGHSGDSINVTSTAHRTRSEGLGDGWVVGPNPVTWAVDRRLGENACQIDDQGNGAGDDDRIVESDILWFTHYREGAGCPRIPWNYDHMLPAGGFAGRYDFYSVILHEMGHLLGLDHGGMGVMQDSLAPNTRTSIDAWAETELAKLYGPGGQCRPPGPDGGTDGGTDASMPDAPVDAGMPDAPVDAGMPDAGPDAGMPDAGPDATFDTGVLTCGDGLCDPAIEDSETCIDDCYCGDGVCDGVEDPSSCPEDCDYLATILLYNQRNGSRRGRSLVANPPAD